MTRRTKSAEGLPWSERELHRWLARGPRPRGLAGSAMHDAAVLDTIAGKPVVCVDQCLEGVHFDPGTAPGSIGRKAANRALSDLAATAAQPIAVTLAIAAPAEATDATLRALISAVRRAARAVGADLVGGDLARTPGPLALTVTALGEHPRRAAPPGRDRARPGQVLLVTGPVGGSRAARHLTFRPRVALGQALAAAGATALMDVSDGLALDLMRLARASDVVFEVDLEAVPIHRDARAAARASGRSAIAHALGDGEDHELIATLPRAAGEALVADPALRRAGARPTLLGRVARVGGETPGAGLWLRAADGRRERFDPDRGPWAGGGYQHGRR